jgi:signal transduction histidine kinase/ActR/RegA family two-component response regulator
MGSNGGRASTSEQADRVKADAPVQAVDLRSDDDVAVAAASESVGPHGAMSVAHRWSGAARMFPAIVVASVVGAAIAGSVIVDGVVRDQEHRLLHERGGELAALLTESVTSAQSSLPVLAQVSQLNQSSPGSFAQAARPLLKTSDLAVGVARERGGIFRVESAAGTGPGVGQPLTGMRAVLAHRALRVSGLVMAVVPDRAQTRLILAVRGTGGSVVYQESAVHPTQHIPSPPGSPFSDVEIALYASAQADRSKLIITSDGHAPSGGLVDRQVIPAGADRLLLLTASRRPLVGSFAHALHWWVLGFGLLVALLTASLARVLTRRRRFAVAAVNTATTELRLALEEQVRLVREQSRLEREAAQAREVAEAANLAKSEFLSRMSHELRTPLNAILGFGQLLERGGLDAEQDKSVDQILKAGRHLLGLIEEVLDISRIEAGTMRISVEPVDTASALGDVTLLIAPVAESAGIKLVADLEAGLELFVLADRQRLRQVILNLLSNAVKYNKPGGSVTLSLDREADRVRISVADTGPGIEPDKLERLFVAFDRLDAEQGSVQGTGLGLAVSKSLVELMGGTIIAESSPGNGSVFSVELIAAANPITADTLADAQQAGRDSQAVGVRTILYIEDNPSNATLVEQVFFDQPDVKLLVATQGAAGVEFAKAHRPDLILLDLNLPDMHGSAVLKCLQADPDTTEIPVIVLSADVTHSQVRSLLRDGASSYLTKPLDIPEFLDEVAKYLPEKVGSQ